MAEIKEIGLAAIAIHKGFDAPAGLCGNFGVVSSRSEEQMIQLIAALDSLLAGMCEEGALEARRIRQFGAAVVRSAVLTGSRRFTQLDCDVVHDGIQDALARDGDISSPIDGLHRHRSLVLDSLLMRLRERERQPVTEGHALHRSADARLLERIFGDLVKL